jgi:HEAT repeat protein
MATVYIAYDSEDSDFAELVEGRLTKAGHSARMDSEIPDAGDAWQDKLDQAIREANVMVVIMTPEARASAYVTYEWAFALGAGMPIVPIELKATPFHPRLEVLKRMDFTDKQRPWETFLREIEKAVEAQQTTTIGMPADTPSAIKNAVAALDSLAVEDQVSGVKSLAKMDHQAARDALAQALQHPVKTVRMAAAFKFPDRTDPRIIPGLIDVYRDIDACRDNDFLRKWYQAMELNFWGIRYDYWIAWIARFGPPAAPYLLKTLQDPNYKVRSLGAQVLGRIAENRAVTPLIGLLTDKFQPVRREAVRALGRIGDKAAVPHLIEALGDKIDSVRVAAAQALGRIGHNAIAELLPLLEDESVRVRAAAAESLGELASRPAVPELLEHLRIDSSTVRAAAARALGRIGDPAALASLVETFQDKGERVPVREAAALAMGLLGDIGAAEVLCAYLTHRQNQDRWEGEDLDFEVAGALLKLKCTDSIDLVGKALGSFRSGRPPVHIVESLGSFGDGAVPVLIGLLENRSLQETSAKVLKEIGTTQALAALAQWSRSH